jgi:hypothetical protein
MHRKHSRVNPLELRKALLIAESELNRSRLIDEWQSMTARHRTLGARVKSVGSLASAVALFVSAVLAFRRKHDSPNGEKPSWLQTGLKGAQFVGSVWSEFLTQFGSGRSGR